MKKSTVASKKPRMSKNFSSPDFSPLTISLPQFLIDNSDNEFRRLVHGMFALLARHEAVRDGHAARIGLAGVEYTVLISISHLSKNQDVSIKTVADHMHVSATFVTRVVNGLINLGLVVKAPLSTDRRRVRLSLSKKGGELLLKLAPFQRKVNDVQFGPLSRQEFMLAIDIVEKLITSSDRAIALQKYLKSNP